MPAARGEGESAMERLTVMEHHVELLVEDLKHLREDLEHKD